MKLLVKRELNLIQESIVDHLASDFTHHSLARSVMSALIEWQIYQRFYFGFNSVYLQISTFSNNQNKVKNIFAPNLVSIQL